MVGRRAGQACAEDGCDSLRFKKNTRGCKSLVPAKVTKHEGIC